MLVFISGQGPFTKDRQLVDVDDVQTQTQQTFENLKERLKAAGSTFDDMVKIDYYLNFGNKDMLIEIEAIAVAQE